ncbi:hypothetical protein WJX81_000202 [Elliptochloris bilobata]|uniref:Thioredoxin domain-containing protein n=1 Tax=Elliptochloris bilobata TaxID=381761 RepID=A0AAW1RRZ5_9CHLO
MAVRKQRRMKTLKGHTITIKNRAHWEKLLNATLDDRLLVVHYSASWSAACKRMRAFLSEVSRKPQFRHVVFAELDVSAEGTAELVEEQGVQAMPTVQAWKLGKCIETVISGSSVALLQIIQDNAGERPEQGGRGSLRRALQALAVGAAVAALALLGARAALKARRSRDETPLDRARRELRDLRRRIETLRKAGRGGKRLGPKDAADRKEKLRELRAEESSLLADVHSLSSSAAAQSRRQGDSESEDEDEDEEDVDGDDDGPAAGGLARLSSVSAGNDAARQAEEDAEEEEEEEDEEEEEEEEEEEAEEEEAEEEGNGSHDKKGS